jgi:hypothetical protein
LDTGLESIPPLFSEEDYEAIARLHRQYSTPSRYVSEKRIVLDSMKWSILNASCATEVK